MVIVRGVPLSGCTEHGVEHEGKRATLERDIKTEFEKYGTVEAMSYIMGGLLEVTFENAESVAAAISGLNDQPLHSDSVGHYRLQLAVNDIKPYP